MNRAEVCSNAIYYTRVGLEARDIPSETNFGKRKEQGAFPRKKTK